MTDTPSNAVLDKMIRAGIKAVDLYEVAKDDVIRHRHLEAFLIAALKAYPAALRHAERSEPVAVKAFGLGDRVQKKSGSSWHGRVVGFYSTELTPVGYCVESEREHGSVQIYPETALEFAPDPHDWQGGSDD